LSQFVTLDFVVVVDFGIKAEILHCLSPGGSVAGSLSSGAMKGEEVGVLMQEGDTDPIGFGHENVAEGDGLSAVDCEAGSDGHSPPFECWEIAHGLGIAGFEQ
jgi:hypothetical protein